MHIKGVEPGASTFVPLERLGDFRGNVLGRAAGTGFLRPLLMTTLFFDTWTDDEMSAQWSPLHTPI
jgi:hypothetical protein